MLNKNEYAWSVSSPDNDNKVAHFLIECVLVCDVEHMLQKYNDFVHEAFPMS